MAAEDFRQVRLRALCVASFSGPRWSAFIRGEKAPAVDSPTEMDYK